MNLVQSFIAFARGSSKRLACFNKFRWILRKPSIISVTRNCSAIINCLEDFENHSYNSAKNKSEAAGYLESFCKFDTLFKLEILHMIFTIIGDAKTALQGMQPNFCKARNTINTLKKVLKEARGDTRFKVLWETGVVAPECSLIEKPEMPRRRKITSKFTESGVPYFGSSRFETGLANCFEPTGTTEHLANVGKFLIGQCLEVGFVEAFYKDDFEDYGRLQLHRDILVDHVKVKSIQQVDFESVLNELVDHDGVLSQLIPLIPEFVKLVKILLCMPVTFCTCEHFFSCLRRLKTYLGSTMSQERLSHLAILDCHCDIAYTLDLDYLIDEFIMRASIRMNTFYLRK
ncbi:uncharacterized protein LOC136092211 [Hydra vulgaris]|uniref:Uncharacterized protein LOC136092211 n=1 Tax=Hydra vulgaris TaxID=6087 RepID=A0ABM4DNC4_HYDVU